MKFHQKVFLLLLLLLPTQLGYHFWPEWASVAGIRVDYLAPTVYLSDALLLFLLLVWSFTKTNKAKIRKGVYVYVLPILFFAVVNTLLASVWQVALYKWIKFGELFFLGWYVKENWSFLKNKVYVPLFFSSFCVLVIALGQLFLQRTIGGVFYFLGERSFSAGTPGIALFSFLGRQYMRPYATFPHPNAMAGFALVVFCLSIGREKYTNKLIQVISSVLILISFSQTAWLAYFAVLFFYKLNLGRKIIFSLNGLLPAVSFLIPIVSSKLLEKGNAFSESVTRRMELSVIAAEIFSQSPWVGVGLGNFITQIPRYYRGFSWWLQPVHNIYLLLLSEIGLLGFFVFWLLTHKGWKLGIVFLAIILMGMTDHYWLSLQSNQLLLAIVFGIMYSKS